MNKKGTIKRVGKILIDYLNTIYNFIDSNTNEIIFVICFIASLLTVKVERFIMITMLYVVSFIVLFVHKIIHKAIEDQIKKDYKRFTKKKSNGDIYIEEDRLNQAIIFMSILEDEYEKK